ncbi:EthD domain-containing protein [Tsukamurella sp. DT100]|uniref:EthD domain-containing protein n=1 Tax=Tsukamurella sp. DT100 TaxID=3393415 RepID=UPI003CEC75FF
MIKLVFCLRRVSSLSPEEFDRYWREDHAALVRRHSAALRIRRYTQSAPFSDPRIAATLQARGSTVAPYDGVAELYWDSIDDLVAVGASNEGRDAGRALLEDERRFIDLAESPIFYTEERIVLP